MRPTITSEHAFAGVLYDVISINSSEPDHEDLTGASIVWISDELLPSPLCEHDPHAVPLLFRIEYIQARERDGAAIRTAFWAIDIDEIPSDTLLVESRVPELPNGGELLLDDPEHGELSICNVKPGGSFARRTRKEARNGERRIRKTRHKKPRVLDSQCGGSRLH